MSVPEYPYLLQMKKEGLKIQSRAVRLRWHERRVEREVYVKKAKQKTLKNHISTEEMRKTRDILKKEVLEIQQASTFLSNQDILDWYLEIKKTAGKWEQTRKKITRFFLETKKKEPNLKFLLQKIDALKQENEIAVQNIRLLFFKIQKECKKVCLPCRKVLRRFGITFSHSGTIQSFLESQ